MKYLLLVSTMLLLYSQKGVLVNLFKTKTEYIQKITDKYVKLKYDDDVEYDDEAENLFDFAYLVHIIFLVVFCQTSAMYIQKYLFTTVSLFFMLSLSYEEFISFNAIKQQHWNQLHRRRFFDVVWYFYLIYNLTMQIKMF